VADLFGTPAGLYESWGSSEDGLTYDGIRRHAAYQAVGSADGHWIIEPDVATAAVAAAKKELGVEGYDTTWVVDGEQIRWAQPESGDFKLVERDDEGRYLLPRVQFPDVVDQVRRGTVDRVIGSDGIDLTGLEYEDAATETWSPEPTRGAVDERTATGLCASADVTERAPSQGRPF